MNSSSISAPGAGKTVPGEPGIWIIIFGDLLIFGIFFITFGVYRQQDPAIFDVSRVTLNQIYGLINTILLLTSSWFVALGLAALRRREKDPASRFILAALLCGLGFVAVKVFEYREKFAAGLTPTKNIFYSLYFTYTGVHLLHVIIGMGALLFMYFQSKRASITPEGILVVEGCAIFWHLVDILWVILFALFYLEG